ncbi:MAG: ROK family protein [Streptosporangiaceae bacterium]|jgi:hypothetical protein
MRSWACPARPATGPASCCGHPTFPGRGPVSSPSASSPARSASRSAWPNADVAAVGEAHFGSARDHRDVAYITISTGIGARLVFGGRLVRADRSLAELGHTIIDREAWQAGLPATLEEMASGSGITRLAEAAGLGPLDGDPGEERRRGGQGLGCAGPRP